MKNDKNEQKEQSEKGQQKPKVDADFGFGKKREQNRGFVNGNGGNR